MNKNKTRDALIALYPETKVFDTLTREDLALVAEDEPLVARLPEIDKEIERLVGKTSPDDARGLSIIAGLHVKKDVVAARRRQIADRRAAIRAEIRSSGGPAIHRLNAEVDALDLAAKTEVYDWIHARVSETPDGVWDHDTNADYTSALVYGRLVYATLIAGLRGYTNDVTDPTTLMNNLFAGFEELERVRPQFPKPAATKAA